MHNGNTVLGTRPGGSGVCGRPDMISASSSTGEKSAEERVEARYESMASKRCARPCLPTVCLNGKKSAICNGKALGGQGRYLNTASAIGERHMLPRQTKSTDILPPSSSAIPLNNHLISSARGGWLEVGGWVVIALNEWRHQNVC